MVKLMTCELVKLHVQNRSSSMPLQILISKFTCPSQARSSLVAPITRLLTTSSGSVSQATSESLSIGEACRREVGISLRLVAQHLRILIESGAFANTNIGLFNSASPEANCGTVQVTLHLMSCLIDWIRVVGALLLLLNEPLGIELANVFVLLIDRWETDVGGFR